MVSAIEQLGKSKYHWPLAGVFDCTEEILESEITNCRFVTLEQLQNLEIDLILICGHGVQRSVLRHLHPLLNRHRNTYLAYFCGNELPHYRWDLVENLLCADERSWKNFGHRVKNSCRYYPWIDYDKFKWVGPFDEKVLVCSIINYEQRYPADAVTAKHIIDNLEGVEFTVSKSLSQRSMSKFLQKSAAMLHIKPEEGYGFGVLESLACGRPIIAPRKYVAERAMQHWCLHGESAILFDSVSEVVDSLRRFFADQEYRHRLQFGAAAAVRRVVDNHAQTEALGRFLQRLRPQSAKGILTKLLDFRHWH